MDHAGDSSFPACFETWIPLREKYVPPRRARGLPESRGRRGSLSRLRAIVSHKGNSGLFARGVGPGWLRPPLEPRSCLPRGVPPMSYLRNSCRRPLPPLRKKTVCPSPRFPWFLTGRRTLRLLCVRRGILGSRVDLYRRLGWRQHGGWCHKL